MQGPERPESGAACLPLNFIDTLCTFNGGSQGDKPRAPAIHLPTDWRHFGTRPI
jgi:hypothetical protein